MAPQTQSCHGKKHTTNGQKSGSITNMPRDLAEDTSTITFSACAGAKERPAPHWKTIHNYEPGQYPSSDTCGPIFPPSTHGNSHFLTYIDAGSPHLEQYFMKDRGQVGIIMHNHMRKLNNEDRTPQYSRTDNALEFKSQAAKNTYAAYGITYKNNTPHQPQENSLAEGLTKNS